MICPECGVLNTRVIETRAEKGGATVTRRHECGNGHRFNTLQLRETTVRSIGLTKILKMSATNAVGTARRALTHQRRLRVARMLGEGIGVPAIADSLGITDARVRQIRSSLAQSAQT